MTAANAQVRITMRERQRGKTLEQVAASANVRSRKHNLNGVDGAHTFRG